MPTISPGQLAFSALRYLPMPVLVLNSLETVVLANEAMGRMLGIIADDLDHDNAAAIIDHLREQTLGPSPSRTKQDVVVDVVISHKDIGKATFDSRYKAKEPKY
ncbi:hypothetical protein DCS_05275 [Drechmeria coniospora]|uniref:PAS domain-containing protein n=1 Tax=Drechmeria coniospora TaxID=98403 RepID=A0A151GMP0_DRECN|nr:hypothetical protein DCS_05275 [Drechmeria coniospora]KYK58262.1 hypothetical protein DCS_05275 [Drechmeria coniospora]